MHLGSLESTQEARVAIGYRLAQLLRIFRALQTSCVHPYFDIRKLSMNKFLNALGHQFLSNGKGYFCPIERNDQTGQSRPPWKLVPNIPVGPNRNSPFRLMYQPKFPEFWIEWKAPLYSRGGSLEKLLGVVWSYWVRVKVRVVNFLSRFFLVKLSSMNIFSWR